MNREHFLRLVHQQKLDGAIAWLRTQDRYVLDAGSKKPNWGVKGEVPQPLNADLLRRIQERDQMREPKYSMSALIKLAMRA